MTDFRKWSSSIDSVHRVKNVTFYFSSFWWSWLKPKIEGLTKWQHYISSINKDVLNRNVGLLKTVFTSMNWCSLLWHLLHQLLHQRGVLVLLKCNGGPGCYDTCPLVFCAVGSGVPTKDRCLRWQWSLSKSPDRHQQMTLNPKVPLTSCSACKKYVWMNGN